LNSHSLRRLELDQQLPKHVEERERAIRFRQIGRRPGLLRPLLVPAQRKGRDGDDRDVRRGRPGAHSARRFDAGDLASVAAIHSLASDSTCFFPGQGILVADPKISPLKWSKVGNTWIHALKSGSPAIEAGSPGYCESVDQRGVLRPIDGDLDGDPQCDIGAAEYSPFKRGWPTEGGP
jgi:hypothetical protein